LPESWSAPWDGRADGEDSIPAGIGRKTDVTTDYLLLDGAPERAQCAPDEAALVTSLIDAARR